MEFPITCAQVLESVRIVAERMKHGHRLYEGFALVGDAHIRLSADGIIIISTPAGAESFIDLTGTVPVFRPCSGHAVCACHFGRELWGLTEYSLERRSWGEGNYVLRSPHSREEDVEVGIGDEFIAIGDDVFPLSLGLLTQYLDDHGY
jgi:hypothetical protein